MLLGVLQSPALQLGVRQSAMLQPTALLWQRAPLLVLMQLTALLLGALQPAALQLGVRRSIMLQRTALLWRRAQ